MFETPTPDGQDDSTSLPKNPLPPVGAPLFSNTLTETDEERTLADKYDHEDSLRVYPTYEEKRALAERQLKHWHRFAKLNPPLGEVAEHAESILTDLNLVITTPEFARLAAEIALELALSFERVKVDDLCEVKNLWHDTLINIYNAIAEVNVQAIRQKLEQAMLRHNMYVGNPKALDALVTSQRRMATLDYPAREDLGVATASIATMLANYDQGIAIARDLLELAEQSGSKRTMARAYGVLSNVYTNRGNAAKAFEYGQMVFSVGIALHDDLLITNGLHYMALSFQISTPERAFQYLEYALEYAVYAGDEIQRDYVWQTWGTCRYYLGDYDEAVYFYKMAIHNNRQRPFGQQYAAALQGFGVSLTMIGGYVEAEIALNQAMAIWEKHGRPVEIIYTQHGLAELYSRMGRHVAAINLIDKAIDAATVLGDRCPPYLLVAMLADRNIYRNRGIN